MSGLRHLGVWLLLAMSAPGAISETPLADMADPAALTQLCEAGEAGPCLELGAMLYAGGETQQAHGLFDRACALGSGAACLRLGLELEFPDFGAPDSAGALAAYARACDLGEQAACERVPAFTSEALPDLAPLPAEAGTGEDPAPDAAAQFAEASEDAALAQERQAMGEACSIGELDACEIYAAWLRDGTGGAQDIVRARRVFSVICTQGSVKGCYELAWMMYDAGTNDLEMSRARFLFSDTCEAGVVEACLQAADMRVHGEGGQADPAGAMAYLQIACEDGMDAACDIAASLAAEVDADAPLPEEIEDTPVRITGPEGASAD